MFQPQMIQQIVEWERRLEIENEKRNSNRLEPYIDFSAAPLTRRKERQSIFARIMRLVRSRQPVDPCRCYAQEHCRETQPG